MQRPAVSGRDEKAVSIMVQILKHRPTATKRFLRWHSVNGRSNGAQFVQNLAGIGQKVTAMALSPTTIPTALHMQPTPRATSSLAGMIIKIGVVKKSRKTKRPSKDLGSNPK